jgi:predicted TPR repeat methyltransferase
MPGPPDPPSTADRIRTWASSQSQFAALLDSGVPTEQALQRWGTLLLSSNRVSEAVEAFRAAIVVSPDVPMGWTNLGVALDRANLLPEAKASLERSVGLSRKQPDAWLLLGLVRKKLGDAAGAEAAYSVALQQQPDSPLVWQCLGLLKEEQHDFPRAIECFATCVAKGQTDAATLANLGRLCYQTGRIAEAAESYAAACRNDGANVLYRAMARRSQFLRDAVEGGSIDEAVRAYRESTASPHEELVQFLQGASWFLASFGHLDVAIRLARTLVELSPESASARYLRDSLSGNSELVRSPPDYIVESFDAFAEVFDAKLVGVLGYDVPEKLAAVVREASEKDRRVDIVDAGCGTGLCGPLVRPLARGLTGIDLSSKMLDQAAKRGVYDVLVCEDVIAALERMPGRFDVAVAADVLIYFGDLGPLFAAMATALRPSGLFAFSVERLSGTGSYRLLPSGRFAHTPEYVRHKMGATFVEVVSSETTIRQDANDRVPGELFLFRRR